MSPKIPEIRAKAIEELILTKAVQSQGQLKRILLSAKGINVSQGQLCKDLRELGYKKQGKSWVKEGSEQIVRERLLKELASDYVVDSIRAGHLYYVSVRDGYAMPLAHMLKALTWPGIFAVCVQDELVTIICRSDEDCSQVIHKIGIKTHEKKATDGRPSVVTP